MLPLELRLEQACDSLRNQGKSRVTKIGLSKVDVCADTTQSPCTILEAPNGARVRRPGAQWSCTLIHSLMTYCRMCIHVMKF